MKKIPILAILLIFSWFQVFQLCDETGDACEALKTRIHTIAQKQFSWTPVQAPHDDADVSLPLVIGQSLTNSRIPIGENVHLGKILPTPHSVQNALLAIPPKNPDPPWNVFSKPRVSLVLIVQDHCPVRSLAPPVL